MQFCKKQSQVSVQDSVLIERILNKKKICCNVCLQTIKTHNLKQKQFEVVEGRAK